MLPHVAGSSARFLGLHGRTRGESFARLGLPSFVSRVLDLQPGEAPARPVAGIKPLEDDALQPQSAGVAEDGYTVALDVLAGREGIIQWWQP
jgi:hypothetical protein